VDGTQVSGSIADSRVPVPAGGAPLSAVDGGLADGQQRAGRVLRAGRLARPRPRQSAVPRSAPAAERRASALPQSRIHRHQGGAGRLAVRRRARLSRRRQRGDEVRLAYSRSSSAGIFRKILDTDP